MNYLSYITQELVKINHHNLFTELNNIIIKSNEDILLCSENFDELITNYIKEILISETSPIYNGDIYEIYDLIIEKKDKPNDISMKSWIYINNIYSTLRYLDISHINTVNELSIKTISNAHSLLVKNCDVINPGEFRTRDVKPNGYNHSYTPYKKVEDRINILITFVNNKLLLHREKKKMNVEIFNICVLFFSEFLHIHPYIDGNGRLARLLVNKLLEYFMLVPISLIASRNEYLNSLFESQVNGYYEPLIRIFIRSIDLNIKNATYLLL